MNTILLVDDHDIIRQGIKLYLKDHKTFLVSDEAANGNEAITKLKSEKFNFLVTDLSMPEMGGIELINYTRENHPNIKILALTMHGEANMIKNVLRENVDGYVLKNSGKKMLIKALESVSNGSTFYDEEVAKVLIEDISSKSEKIKSPTAKEISQRERQILKLMSEQFTNEEIAESLNIGIRTVEAHQQNLLEKTGTKSLVKLIMYSIENELI